MDIPKLQITSEYISLISKIEVFKGRWQAMSSLAPDRLALLKHVATIESVGSSTRIEGANLTDSEVERYSLTQAGNIIKACPVSFPVILRLACRAIVCGEG